jgi:DNA-binding transcriptional regulator YdaS (Cro superfamily)
VLICKHKSCYSRCMSTQFDDPPVGAEHPIDVAARAAGGRAVLAERLGIKPSAIGNWKDRGVPLEHCAAIERESGGKVTRKDLRPSDWQDIWPELAAYEAAAPAPAFVADQEPRHA